ncbi:glycosyltransferase family 39 protein [Natronomonas sp.]|uniref:DUF7846 domain-containing protein n=1 Tax=Natronomonas sp. TaxID=2184060 RepID=UPI00260834B9|nr:glycosyltransferase family 39 protein [Natronomonas sp.]
MFGYHSSNHDEAVYLLQAAMLLEGQLAVQAGELAGAFRPWFFIEDGGRLYPKYTPVPAAMFAVSMGLFGEPRVTLAVVAAANAALVYLLGTMLAGRRVGAVAAVAFAASPMALVTTAAFLPYAPTTLWNLLFAVAYLRGLRDGSAPAAAVAGVAIGIAFFARPFTAVLFAAPFVCHALYRVVASLHREGLWPPSGAVRRQGLTAAIGLCFVGVTLAYNLRMTGSPLVFPYEAFAPLDGPGFGRRRILEHSIVYSPAVALESNGYALWYLLTRWFTAGAVGSAFALGGVGYALYRAVRGRGPALGPGTGPGNAIDDVEGRGSVRRPGTALVGGLFVTVPVGNVFFWGNHNMLATRTDPTDGIVSQFGPIYHFDLLVPLSVFAAIAAVACWRALPALRSELGRWVSPAAARGLVVAVVLAAVVFAGAVNAAAVSGPLERNAAHGDKHATAYEPIEEASFDDALVFLPTPYGEWQNHPFQYLRNDPGLDGDVVYALDRGPGEDFEVIDAYPDRTRYRYAYQGEWTPDAARRVTPKLEAIEPRRGETLRARTTVGVPDRVDRVRVRLDAGGDERAGYTVEDPTESFAVGWSLRGDGARLDAPGADAVVGLDGPETVVVTVTLVQPGGSTLTYRQEASVRTTEGGVEVVWPPERYVCRLVTECGNEGTYLPDDPDAHLDGVRFETRIESAEGASDRPATRQAAPNGETTAERQWRTTRTENQ